MVCLVSCGVMTGAGAVMNRAKIEPGSTVAVWGCGGIGLNAIQAAALMGAAKVIAVDVFDQKLEWSREFGATHLVNASQEDPVAADPGDLRRGGADYAIEAVGIPEDDGAGVRRDPPRRHGRDDRRRAGRARGSRSIRDAAPGADPDRHRRSAAPRQRVDLPKIVDMFMDGKYKLRELISQFVDLEDINRPTPSSRPARSAAA